MDIKIKKKLVKNWFISLQEIICSEIIKIEKKNAKFKTKEWKRNDSKDEGGGKSRVLENGDIFDKVGVNFSEVYGKFSKEFKNKIPGTEKVNKFWATGISIVMHMKNPHVPAIHFNTRYIYTDHGWFGGGIDVTPSFNDKNVKKILFKELKKVCDRQNKNTFKKYKKWCDEYFYLPHRKEARGIGGIFFDYKKDNWNKDFSFVRELGVSFIKIFNKIISARKNKKWNKSQKNIQFLKRGRYVEFNLLYDRGTKFGLNSGGNIDSILMSLPPQAKWK